jgi:DNA-binding MarR family transcriptional regulator
MTEGADRGAEEPPVKWLTAAEVRSWLSMVRMMTWLPWSIDQQLQRDSDLGMVEYQVLAMLSDSPERTMRMSSLADVTNASLSRLSHLVKRLEGRGLVRREPDPADGRFTNAILTDKGFQTLAEAAPGHVAHVRSLVIDVLSPEQLRRLGLVADRIMSRIDTSEINKASPGILAVQGREEWGQLAGSFLLVDVVADDRQGERRHRTRRSTTATIGDRA